MVYLTVRQMNELRGYLEQASASEADPDAVVSTLIDVVREARKQAINAAAT